MVNTRRSFWMHKNKTGDLTLDQELKYIASAKRGDIPAFEILYRQYSGRIYGLCLRLCSSTAVAEELTQETFVRAWQKLPKYRGESKFVTWAHKIAVNLTMSYFRANKIQWQQLEELDGEYQDNIGQSRDLENAIKQLPDGARAVLVLHDIEGYSHPQISTMLDIAVGTSKAQLSRARQLLKRLLT